MQTFRIVPVEGQEKFWNIIRNSNSVLVGKYDGIDKSLEFKRDVIRLHEMEELVEQVKEL